AGRRAGAFRCYPPCGWGRGKPVVSRGTAGRTQSRGAAYLGVAGFEGEPLEAGALWQHSDSELREGGQVRGTAGGRREIALHAGGITLPPSGKIAGTERPLRSQASRRQTR